MTNSNATKKSERVAFRAKPQEILLLAQLKNDWRLNDYSKVLHRILATFHGVAIKRAEAVANVRQELTTWDMQHHEVFKK